MKKFFIIWNPESSLPPTVQFETRAQAVKVAESMASRYGESFFVLRVVSLSVRGAAVTTAVK